jgi:Transglutaminase-like superfamily
LRPGDIRACWWAVAEARRAKRQLAADPLSPTTLRPPPSLAERHGWAIDPALRRLGFSCLVRARVRQAWHAAHGVQRAVMIGVTAPAEGFSAHAWLEGDDGLDAARLHELMRLPEAR